MLEARDKPMLARSCRSQDAATLQASCTGLRSEAASEECRLRASYVLITTGADVVLLPEVSVATTVIVCCPLASDPVSHHCVDWQVAAPPHDTWANWLPSPKYVRVASPTLSPPLAVTSMLLPVHAPFEGLVIVTVGGVVSPVPVPFDTVMLTE